MGAQVVEGGQHLLVNGVLRIDKCPFRLLLQIAQAGPFGQLDLPFLGRAKAGQQAQEGGFANAIWPHQADGPVTRDVAAQAAEEVNLGEGLSEVVKG